MRVALRSLLVCVLGVVLGGSLLVPCVSIAGLAGGKASSDAAVADSPLVVPDAEWLFGVVQQEAAVEARRDSPGAFADRLVSRTEFEHLGAAGAARVARDVFPALIEKHDGGLPTLPAGENSGGSAPRMLRKSPCQITSVGSLNRSSRWRLLPLPGGFDRSTLRSSMRASPLCRRLRRWLSRSPGILEEVYVLPGVVSR